MQQLRLKTLINQLNDYRDSYYNDNASVVSDKEYDALYDELELLEKELNIIYSNSPTQQVGYEVKSKLQKVTHPSKMLSLNKTKDIEQLKRFLGSEVGMLSWKLDGLTIVLIYEDGELKQAVTRGNGEIGEEITHNTKLFKNIPQTIPFKERLILRGEAVISYDNFNKINSNLSPEEQYKNPRNLCSGSVRQLDSRICAERKVDFIAFNVIEGLNNKTRVNDLIELDTFGFTVVECSYVTKDNIEDVMREYTENSKTYKYAVDGLVLTFDDIKYGQSLGLTSHHPLHSLAFKWKDDSVESILRDILVDVGKSGQVSYTAIFDPVEIEGTTVERASLHNYNIISELEIGIGDSLEIIKSNMIIPQVFENNTRSGTYKKVLVCPICGNTLVHDGVHQFCKNYYCDRQIVGRLAHWCSRDAMNIDGISEETIKAIRTINIDNGESILQNISDFYVLDKYKYDIYKLDRFGKKKVDNLLAAIENSKSMPLSNVIYGLSIPQVGGTASNKLADEFEAMEMILKRDYLDSELKDLIGNSVGQSFIDNVFNRCEIQEIIDELFTYGLKMTQPRTVMSNTLQGLIFVITGSLNHFTNRDELVSKIESLGGKTSSGVSKNTSYLINNDTTSTSGKNKKAMGLGVKIINEGQFLVMI